MSVSAIKVDSLEHGKNYPLINDSIHKFLSLCVWLVKDHFFFDIQKYYSFVSIEVEFRLNFRTFQPDSRETITLRCGEKAQKEFWQGQIRMRKKWDIPQKNKMKGKNKMLVDIFMLLHCFSMPYSMWSWLLRQWGTQEPVYHHQFYDESLPMRFLPLHGICCQVLHLWFHIFGAPL